MPGSDADEVGGLAVASRANGTMSASNVKALADAEDARSIIASVVARARDAHTEADRWTQAEADDAAIAA